MTVDHCSHMPQTLPSPPLSTHRKKVREGVYIYIYYIYAHRMFNYIHIHIYIYIYLYTDKHASMNTLSLSV